jgi:NAD(P)-dependent dehydrogenase (short-subunit alcohol dehydrogenase family)
VAIIAHFAIYHWHSLMLHANIRLNFWPLSWLVASPEFHHWHHSNRPEAHDKNFAGQIALWDFVFGTAHPKGEKPGQYGTDDPVRATYVEQIAYPLRSAPQSAPQRPLDLSPLRFPLAMRGAKPAPEGRHQSRQPTRCICLAPTTSCSMSAEPQVKRMAGYTISLQGKTALITGASSGFGWHFAKVLSAAGAKVALGARRLDRLQKLQEEIRAAGGEAAAVALDVTDTASVKRAFDAAETALGPITILINNAGVPSGSYFAKTSDEDWRSVLDVNLDGVFRAGREAAQRMIAHGKGGSIINIASILGLGAIRTLSSYSASKAAVIALTKSMALELARDRIRVNALAPGYFSTEFNDAFLASEAGLRLLSRVPMRRAGRLEELDGPLLLLASHAGAFMTGSVLTVDGGHVVPIG